MLINLNDISDRLLQEPTQLNAIAAETGLGAAELEAELADAEYPLFRCASCGQWFFDAADHVADGSRCDVRNFLTGGRYDV